MKAVQVACGFVAVLLAVCAALAFRVWLSQDYLSIYLMFMDHYLVAGVACLVGCLVCGFVAVYKKGNSVEASVSSKKIQQSVEAQTDSVPCRGKPTFEVLGAGSKITFLENGESFTVGSEGAYIWGNYVAGDRALSVEPSVEEEKKVVQFFVPVTKRSR